MITVDPSKELAVQIAAISQRFADDARGAAVTVRREDGLYRHLELELPEASGHIDVVTWPGSLAVTGTTGTYVFHAEDDMIAFFRRCAATGENGHSDASYWAEKVQPYGVTGVQVYAEEQVRTWIRKAAQEAELDHPGLLNEVMDELLSPDNDVDLTCEAGARAALAAFEFDGFVFDASSCEFTQYDDWFLYTCQALAWALTRYDAVAPAA